MTVDGKSAYADLREEVGRWIVALPPQQKTALYIKNELGRHARRISALRSFSRSIVFATLLSAAFAVATRDAIFCVFGAVWIACGIGASAVARRTQQKVAYLEAGREALRGQWTGEGIEPGKLCVLDADGTIGHLPKESA